MTHRMIPLIAIPQDNAQTVERQLQWREGLTDAILTASKWWLGQLGSLCYPYRIAPVETIGLKQNIADYACDTQNVIRTELSEYYTELQSDAESGVLYLVYAALGSAPYECPGNVIGTSPNLIVQSSGSLDAFADGNNPLDPTTGSRDLQIGALAHEIGHSFGLDHPMYPQPFDTVMYSWWLFPNCPISSDEWLKATQYTNGW